MSPALLVTMTGVLAIVGIYFWWVRKPQMQPTREKFPVGAHDARP